jgi:soluble lytic murein transglycosylase-like protein
MKVGNDQGRTTLRHALALVLLLAACPARADVMDISDGTARWIAGGPHRALPRAAAPPRDWAPILATLAQRYDLSPAMIEALVWQESRWRSDAVSPKGPRGLAQLMPGTARDLDADPADPVQNLTAGARYLRSLVDRFHGNLDQALAAYNAGPARVERAGGVPRIAETQGYVAAIMARLAAESSDRR